MNVEGKHPRWQMLLVQQRTILRSVFESCFISLNSSEGGLRAHEGT